MRTLIIIKPDGVRRGLIGRIIGRFEGYGIKILGLKILNVEKKTAEKLYNVHKEKPFFSRLMEYITSGPVVVAVLEVDRLEAEDAIKFIRKVVGATNPLKADMGSIRGDYGMDIDENIIHASDSEKSADYEIPLFFKDDDLTEYFKKIK